MGKSAHMSARRDSFRGAVDIAPGDTQHISETEAWLFLTMEEQWIKPCRAYVGDPLLGLCMFGPAFAVALCIMLPVLFISMRQQRQAAAEAEAAKAKKK